MVSVKLPTGAAERIRARLAELREREEEIEYRYTLPDPWKRRLPLALCRRYGLEPYRERGQRQTSVMLRAPKSFQDRTLWPEYQALSQELNAHLEELTTRVIREAIDDDVSEAAESTTTKSLPGTSVEWCVFRQVGADSSPVCSAINGSSSAPTQTSGGAMAIRSGSSPRRFFCASREQ